MSDSIFEKEAKYFFHTYHRLPLDIQRGDGVYLYSKEGKRYIDFFGGLAVNALGYNHPRIIKAIEEQIHRYIHLSNYYAQDKTVELAERIIRASGYKKVFFSNSGTEGMEGAIKIARRWGHQVGKINLVNLTNSFHGRSMGALSLTDRPNYRNGYEPFLPNTISIKFNDVEDLRTRVNDQTLAITLEFIQGEGGINVVSNEFVDELRTLKEKFGFLIIADEIQAGVGRTGRFFCFEHYNINPDIVVIAKAIGGGLPLGVIIGNEKVEDILSYGAHGTTFGGNPVACAAGCAVMEEIVDNNLMKQASIIGEYLFSKMTELKNNFPKRIKEVRGKGCMIGIEIDRAGDPIVDELRNRGFLINCTNTTVLRLLPPYIINKAHCDSLAFEMHSIFQTLT